MLRIRELGPMLLSLPLENRVFSLMGGVILLETQYIENLVRFDPVGVHGNLARMLFRKPADSDLSPTMVLSVDDQVMLSEQLYRLYQFEIKVGCFLQWLYSWTEELGLTTYNDLLASLSLFRARDSPANFLIFYILQAYTVMCMESHDDYKMYVERVKDTATTDKDRFSIQRQSAVLRKLHEIHYPQGVPRLCYTRIAHVSGGLSFPDCCVSSLRNFCNVLLYDPCAQKLNPMLLERVNLPVSRRLIDFYTANQDLESLQYQTVHNLWAKATMDLDKLDMAIQYIAPRRRPSCELSPGVQNMKRVCKVLFGSSSFHEIVEQFNHHREEKLTLDTEALDSQSLCTPDYSNYASVGCSGETFYWYFLEHHFRSRAERSSTSLQGDIDADSDWLLELLRHSTQSPTQARWVKSNSESAQLLHLFSYSLRTPDDVTAAVRELLTMPESLKWNRTQGAITTLFNGIPNDDFHLYNKLLLKESASKISASLNSKLQINL